MPDKIAMVNWLDAQRDRIGRGELLGEDTLTGVDLDALLDRRDAAAFDTAWNAAFTAIEARWYTEKIPRSVDKAIDRLRKAAFKAVSRATAEHGIAAYVSDDFELIARARALEFEDAFVAGLWAAYKEGRVPS